ncbi:MULTISPECIES: alkane 1-monooxygenase [Halocynthiibacter]|uniref:Alkane 1-monooxygenase n=1 Tax=Halocynthiibacter halioticoli TaxID=2986804 RepID=A0AAE3J0E9_9RHOB|nr:MULTISPECIES: alkane 1-monooxygenase [Halocynthiibacter]MCV6825682.1 alkane 1-monooxygenase [Halocynthiibacter halioticoli]MCW4058683.1 alkane 1-monooxygenase [Halocynthiibacter sp. SDUM655004]
MTNPNASFSLTSALPFWLSLGMIPLAIIGAVYGGWFVVLLPLYGWFLFGILDALTGLNLVNFDPNTPESDLFWYRLITLMWFPIQFCVIFGLIAYVPTAEHLGALEKFGLFFGVGVISGAIGITYAHELMHQKNRVERWLADLLLATVLYSHFRSEHLLVHHIYVGTPRDPVTARYNEGFHRFYPRVLRQCWHSAWSAEKRMQLRRKKHPLNLRNPFWRYWALQLLFLALACAIGGFEGMVLFLVQAGVAIWQLELTNYIEHYGLTRKHLGDGKYEHVKPRHSWNAAHKASNWLLINLQRHSDHHYKPDRRFPLLQNYDEDEAPQLPFGYPVMTFAAMIPPLWRRTMNPRVRAWRKKYYPEITDWEPYKTATTPMPR